MTSRWVSKTLGEFAPFKYGKGLPQRERSAGPYPVIGSGGVSGSHVAPLVQGPALVVGRKGTVGSVFYMPKGCWPIDTAYYIEDDVEQRDLRFTFYMLKTLCLEGMNQDSAVPGLNREHAHRITILVPPLDEQRRIAGVLGALDDLIEVNRRLVSDLDASVRLVGLEALASAQGRPLVPLTEIADVAKGYSYRSSELIPGDGWLVNLKNIGRSGTFEARGFKPLTATVKAHHLVENGDVLVAQTDLTQDREVIARPVRLRKGTLVGRLVASLDLAIVRPKAPHTRESIFAILNTEDFRAHALGYCNGTTVLHMGARALPDYFAPSLTGDEIEGLTARVSPLYEAADALNIEISDLEATRDELLPLLMSGRVRVSEELAA